MTEPPRPPGDYGQGSVPDPTSPPPPPPASYPPPGEAPASGYAPPPPGPGYAPPPAGGYQAPQGGYAPGGFQPAPAPMGYANNDEKTWALVAHFGGAAGMLIGAGCGGWLPPLIALLAKGNESPTVRAHAVAALNFQILWSIIGVVGWILACIIVGIFIALAAMIVGIIFGVLAGIKANEGQFYKYPMSLNMIK